MPRPIDCFYKYMLNHIGEPFNKRRKAYAGQQNIAKFPTVTAEELKICFQLAP